MVREDTLATAGVTPQFDLAQNMTVFPSAKHDYLGMYDLLTPEERAIQTRVRQFAVSHGAQCLCHAATADVSKMFGACRGGGSDTPPRNPRRRPPACRRMAASTHLP